MRWQLQRHLPPSSIFMESIIWSQWVSCFSAWMSHLGLNEFTAQEFDSRKKGLIMLLNVLTVLKSKNALLSVCPRRCYINAEFSVNRRFILTLSCPLQKQVERMRQRAGYTEWSGETRSDRGGQSTGGIREGTSRWTGSKNWDKPKRKWRQSWQLGDKMSSSFSTHTKPKCKSGAENQGDTNARLCWISNESKHV